MNRIDSQSLGRNSSIELLRVIAMLMIVAYHYSIHGVQQVLWTNMSTSGQWITADLTHKLFTLLIAPGGQIGVGVFFTITGYFMIKQPVKLSKIGLLIYQVLFYSYLSLIVFIVIKYLGLYDFNELPGLFWMFVHTMLPVTSGLWWFVSAYVFLYLLSPVLNNYLVKLSRKGFLFLIFLFGLCWYGVSPFNLLLSNIQKAVFFYILGAYIQVYGIKQLSKRFLIAIFIAMWLLNVLVLYCKSNSIINTSARDIHDIISLYFVSTIIVPIAVISLFSFFLKVKINNSLINVIGRTTFGIYLLHDSPVFRSLIWNGLVQSYLQYLSVYYILYAAISIIVVFMCSAMIELCRLRYVEPSYYSIRKKIEPWLLKFHR